MPMEVDQKKKFGPFILFYFMYIYGSSLFTTMKLIQITINLNRTHSSDKIQFILIR